MNKTINKTIGALAITALFFFPWKGFPQEINETAATETVQAAQMAEGSVINLAPGRVYWP